jgi:exodeoxyribonuclease VII large subunit
MDGDSLGLVSLSVRQALDACNTALHGLGPLLLEGEVTEYRLNQDKFVFFKLKDESGEAVVDCFAMKFVLSMPLSDGMKVRMVAEPKVHQKSGKFSFVVKKAMILGEGNLKIAFEQLKQRLQAEGLFSAQRKRELPRYPQQIAVLSSRDAAGFGDFMRILGQRLPGVACTLYQCAVQGMRAERELISALERANERHDIDAIIIMRGGGSAEDLQVFNSELLARAIVRSRIPVMVAVGHERDVSIADYVADVRAATPTNAAQLLVPTQEEFTTYLHGSLHRMKTMVLQQTARQQRMMQSLLNRAAQQITQQVSLCRQRVTASQRAIEALAPHAVLARGYALVTDHTGNVLQGTAMIAATEKAKLHVYDGTLSVTITSHEPTTTA